MTHLTKNSQNHLARLGLYCVWIPLRDDGRPPLISIWIHPKMTVLEAKPLQESAGHPGTCEDLMAEEIGDPKRTIAAGAISIDVATESIS